MNGLLQDWQEWHHGRLAAVTAPHGIASLSSTNWLGPTPLTIADLGERWVEHEGRAQRDDGSLAIAPGEHVEVGGRLLRAIAREGQVALRVFDPDAPGRTSLVGIDAFDVDAAWMTEGRFEPAPAEAVIGIDHVGGRRSADALAGTVHVSVAGQDLALSTFPGADGGSWFVFADATNGRTTKQFRFLALDAPDANGSVVVDFNRAYLPPCAFSDAYLCPLPPPENRLGFAVTAGETFPRYG